MQMQMISTAALDVHGPKVVFTIPGIDWKITETVVVGWILIAVFWILCIFLTRNLKKKPETKRQIIAEMLVKSVNNMVRQNMGERYMKYTPYIAMLISYAAVGSLVSLLGLRSITADVNTTITWGVLTFILMTYEKIRKNGFLGYLKGYTQPVAVITPINIISEVATPVSMAFRLFGNIAGGMVITGILYYALASLSSILHLSFAIGPFAINVFQVGIPAVLSVYFDLFTGCIQAYIFATLTMVNVAQD
ncbi:MAG: F0F1 ATP synthase subunit A [Ruminococcus sp.]|nr:F0F1 ATP synthase subunit A [Ruminococcus sp.]